MFKKSIIALLLGTAVFMTACGGKAPAADNTETETAAEETVTEENAAETAAAAEETADDAAQAATEPAAEESTLASRYEDDMARYQTVIDGLQDGQAYGFADISDVDVLLVADHVYDNLDGNMVAMKADVYCINGSDEVVKYGTVESTDSGYPLYVTADKCLMFGGNHKLTKVYVDIEAGAIITFQEFTETFNADGEATYHYLSMDEGIDEDVEDDSAHVAMLEQYETGTPVNFTTVGEAAAGGVEIAAEAAVAGGSIAARAASFVLHGVGVVLGVASGAYFTTKHCNELIEKCHNYYLNNAEKISNSYIEADKYLEIRSKLESNQHH